MSLDVWLNLEPKEVECECDCGHKHTKTVCETVFEANITHNLNTMADEAGIYKHCWRPEEIGITKAEQLIEPLAKAIEAMKLEPARFKKHNAKNGWGLYENFVPWLESYLKACKSYPNATISVSR